LDGMSRERRGFRGSGVRRNASRGKSPLALTALEERIVPYAAAIEQRRHRQRGGDRRPGSRGGVFRQ
ncbi:hypothetical protein ACFWOG_40240, partial [Kitasatospora sp. NPDC058406]|uniref:hypothetical protein n=1 Tax=Kitasatospora sp. NPDC058406 TaxID=3346483 RepID=UPI003656B62F